VGWTAHRSPGRRGSPPRRRSRCRICAAPSSKGKTWCESCRRERSARRPSAPTDGGKEMRVQLSINGETHEADVEPRLLLVRLIRDVLRLTGTHIGCDTTHCGACTVLLEGRPVKSCTMFAVQARGKEIMTVEGLEQNGQLHPLQEGFMAEHGLQCGYCTPGM